MEMLLNLTPLELLIMAEARMALYRLYTSRQTATSDVEMGLASIRKSMGDPIPILEMQSDHAIPVYHYSRLFKVIIDLDFWKNRDPVFPEHAQVWFTDGSRADSGTGS
jgi:hypothetical protein